MSFVHLHQHTEYSQLDGCCRIKDLVAKAKALGQTALAITDHGNMYGTVEFYKACKDAGIKPIIGCELYTAEGSIYQKAKEKRGHITLLAKDNTGYHNLVKLVSMAATDGYYYKPRIDYTVLEQYHEGLICLSGCLQGEIPQKLLAGDMEGAYALASRLKGIFGEDFFIEIQYHGLEEERKLLSPLVTMSRALQIPLAATNDVHYIEKEDAFAQRVLMCIGMKATINDERAAEYTKLPEQFYLKSEEEMRLVFDSFAPSAIENTAVIADRCNVELEMGTYHLPTFPLPNGWSSNARYLRTLCEAGLKRRYGEQAEQNRERLEMELGVIEQMGFVDYFLIVYDIIAFAKFNGIAVGPGRGSAAGSIVAYCLGITDIEPIGNGLLFERFLNPERVSMPDVDIDIDPEYRDLVLDHIVETYGADRVAQIITYGSLAAKSAVRDAGKALELDADLVTKVSRLIPSEPGITLKSVLDSDKSMKKLYESDSNVRMLLDVCLKLEGLVRHTSTHAAGVIIAPTKLTDYIPITRATGKENDGLTVSQFEMTAVEAVGMLKVDLLGLKTLTVMKQAEAQINAKLSQDAQFSLKNVPLDDPAVYDMMARGQTSGVFQFESEGMRDVLRRLRPSCFEDLVSAIALYRPGPMDSIPQFIENKHSGNVTYLHPYLKPILESTYGTIVFQEQVMAIVRELAGYSYGRADLVRRAMAKKKPEVLAAEKEIFINGKDAPDGSMEVEGCLYRGISEDVANQLWDLMEKFAAYAFNRAHAVAYAVVAYQTAYLRCHYPLEFMAAHMTVADTKKLVKLINDCHKSGIEILPPDINRSGAGFTVEGNAIRFGLSAIKETSKAILADIINERTLHGPYRDLHDMTERTNSAANKRTLDALIKSGALDSFPQPREVLIQVVEPMLKAATAAKKKHMEAQQTIEELFIGKRDSEKFSFPEIQYPTNVEPWSRQMRLKMEMEATGLYVSGHPMREYEEEVLKRATHTIGDLLPPDDEDANAAPPVPEGTQVRVAGVITIKRVKTTKQKRNMAILTIEDETGQIDCTVFPRAYEAYGARLVEGEPILVFGKVENSAYGLKVVADSISFLAPEAGTEA